MPPRITRNHEYAKVLSRTVKTNRGFTSLANTVNAIDSADVTQILSTVSASTLEVYDTLDSLPTSSLTKGGQGYVKATQRLYVSDSFGWYSMALVNLTPTQTLDPSGNVTLSTDGTSTIVTITATDSDQPESQLSYSVESDGNMLATGTTVTQDSSVFTITPLTEAGGAVAGNFTLTFKTTDNINIASTTKDFSLAFTTPPVSGSTSTIALMKADGNGKTNSDITYYNSSNTKTGFTETGDPTASTFSPYRSGGYSTYFDGSGDYLQYAASNSTVVNWHSQSTTMEAWIYLNSSSDHLNDYPCIFSNGEEPGSAANTNYWGFGPEGATPYLKFQYYNGSSQAVTSSTQFPLHEWVHVAMVHSSSAIKLYQNGVEVASASVSGTPQNSSSLGLVTGGAKNGVYNGYIRDARLVHSAVYTAAFTPPTEALTAIANTQVLLCHLPYITDGSTNDFAITVGGDARTVPFGPYDYLPWAVDDNVGSVHFDGNDYMLGTDDVELGSSNFTFECWYYKTANSVDGVLFGKRGNTWISGDWLVQAASTNQIKFWSQDYNNAGVTPLMTASAPPGINKWVHVAVTRSGSSWTIWVDGKSAATATWSGTIGNHANPTILGADLYTGARLHHSGYIADCNVHVGVVKYSSAFTPPTSPVARESGSQTKFQMQNRDTILSTQDANVYDVASAGRITLLGNASTNSSVRKFTTSSSIGHGDGGVRFDDLTPEYTGGDFTVQFWLYPSSWNNNGHVFGHWVGGQYHQWLIYTSTTTYWKFYASSNGSTWNLASAQNTSIDRWTNSWKHVAMTYDQSAGTVKFWLDGTLESTFTGITGLTSNSYTSSPLSFGADQGSNYPAYSGYIQDVKVSRSVEYTTNFTPPTTEFEL